MPPERTEEQNEKKNRKRLWIILAIVLFFIIVATAVIGYFVVAGMSTDANGEEEGNEQVKIEDLRMMTLESFTVNLADLSYRRYLRTTITLEYVSKDVEEEINRKMHRLKDIILTVLRSKKVSEIDSPEETDKLKEELLQAINAQLTTGKIRGLYFEEFIIQ